MTAGTPGPMLVLAVIAVLALAPGTGSSPTSHLTEEQVTTRGRLLASLGCAAQAIRQVCCARLPRWTLSCQLLAVWRTSRSITAGNGSAGALQ